VEIYLNSLIMVLNWFSRSNVFLDRSGGISQTEFKIMMKRLHFNLSNHRIEEIFTRVKKNKNQTELDEPG
jgi:Ca2+-binding EF-hand superfamily protein